MELDLKTINSNLEELGKAVKEFVDTNDERYEKTAKKQAVAEITEKVDRIHADVEKFENRKMELDTEIKAQRERIEQLESMMSAGRGGRSLNEKLQEEWRDDFYKMLQQGGRTSAAEKCMQSQEKAIAAMPQSKQVSLQDGPSGEYLLPEIIRAEIEVMEEKNSPVRQLIPVVNITSNDFKQIVDILGTGSGWVGEVDNRALTGTPQLRQRAPTMGELYARPEATQWSAMDLGNVDGWLARSVTDEFIKQEGIAVISGNGTNRPTGFLNTTPVADPDQSSPLRDPDALQFIAAPSPDDITEHLYALSYALQTGYRAGAAWAMNSNTIGKVRRAKDSTGQYLWQPSLIVGEPPTIDGKRFVTWEDMPEEGTGTDYPIALGAWGRGYLLVQRSEIRVIRDEITNPGFIRWYFFRREGGIILNNDAIKVARR